MIIVRRTRCHFRTSMSQEGYRRVGAIAGLLLGIGFMWLLNLRGIMASAFFGAGGCVVGAVTAERLHGWMSRGDGG